jgi:hypothetical protein
VVAVPGRTADPSTTLLRSSGRDDKGRGMAKVKVVAVPGYTAGPSTTLRFGRDDKGREVAKVKVVAGLGCALPSLKSVPGNVPD